MSPGWTAAAARSVVEPVLAAVFPTWCAACGTPLDRPLRAPLCEACWRLPSHHGPSCACGFVLPQAQQPPCGRCRRGLNPFAAGASLGPYEAGLRALVHELKYHGRRRIAELLAERMVEERSVRRLFEGDPVVVPVPLHPRRQAQRGFNQAELLARALVRRAGAVLEPAALVKLRETAPQAGLSAAARRRNVTGAYFPRRRAGLEGRTVLLVDDVFTTGATARACTRALRQAGAREVRVLSVARVRRD